MFTGIIENIGIINKIQKHDNSIKLFVSSSFLLSDIKIGDSITVNGVCLTVSDFSDDDFIFDVVKETLDVTNLGNLKTGNCVNLERAIRYNDRVGGHLLQGHIDSTASIHNIKEGTESVDMTLSMRKDLISYCIYKGSIGINGVSLTIASTSSSL